MTGASTSPVPAPSSRRYAGPQGNRTGVDGFLSQRAEALPLERALAPTYFPAHEQLLQAIVHGAREHHAAQDLATLVGGQRRANRFAGKKAVAGLDDFGARLLESRDGGGPRRRLVDPVGRGKQVVEAFGELAAERWSQRVDGGGAAVRRRPSARVSRASRAGVSARDGARRRTRRNDDRDRRAWTDPQTGTCGFDCSRRSTARRAPTGHVIDGNGPLAARTPEVPPPSAPAYPAQVPGHRSAPQVP